MAQSFFLFVLAALAFAPQQDTTPPTPSVADAARAARERQKASAAKHVLTDDDVSHTGANGGSSASGVDEAQARAQLQRDPSIPLDPTVEVLQWRIRDFSTSLSDNVAIMQEDMKRGAVNRHEKVEFPGKKEWAEQMNIAVANWLGEMRPAAARLKEILEQNRDALSRGVPGTSQKVRAQMIDALVPYTIWQTRVHQLYLDGEARSEAAAKAQAQPH